MCSTDCSRAVEAERQRKRSQDPEYRAAQAERQRKYRQDNPEYRAAQAERKRKRRSTEEYRAAERKRRSSPEFRAAVAERMRVRYQSDPEYRAAVAERERNKYQSDPEYRAAQAERRRSPEYRRRIVERYHERKAETVSRMLAMLNSGELAAYGAEPYFLYRFYDEDGTLLYIGITNDPERRLYQHTVRKPWADDIARTEYAVFPNKTSAVAAEAALIKELGPLHNIVHNKVPLTSNENRQNGQH